MEGFTIRGGLCELVSRYKMVIFEGKFDQVSLHGPWFYSKTMRVPWWYP